MPHFKPALKMLPFPEDACVTWLLLLERCSLWVSPLDVSVDVLVLMQVLQSSSCSCADRASAEPRESRSPVCTGQPLQQRPAGHQLIHQTQMLTVAGEAHHPHQILLLQTDRHIYDERFCCFLRSLQRLFSLWRIHAFLLIYKNCWNKRLFFCTSRKIYLYLYKTNNT